MQRPMTCRLARRRQVVAHLSQPGHQRHDAAVDTGQSCSGGGACRNDRDAGWRQIALCALGGAGRQQGDRLRLHRAGECIEKYFETVQDLRKRGYAVAMIDWRGQGHSSRQLRNPFEGHVENFSEYEIDVAAFVQQVVLPNCPPPYFALAHSMGGAVMLRVAHAGIEAFERFVLCAPMIDLPGLRASLPMRGLMRMLRAAGMGERFIPGGNVDLIKSTGFPGNPLTSDPHRYARNAAILEADPTLGLRRRAWRGLTRPLRRWASFVRSSSPAGFASRS